MSFIFPKSIKNISTKVGLFFTYIFNILEIRTFQSNYYELLSTEEIIM